MSKGGSRTERINSTSTTGFAPGVEQQVFGAGAAPPQSFAPGFAGSIQRAMAMLRARSGGGGAPGQFSPLRGGAVQAGLLGIGGEGALNPYLNPFTENVVAGTQADFDRLRQQAQQQAGFEATQQGAGFGGRRAVLEAERMRGLDQLEAQQLANLRFGGFQNAQQMALQDLLQRSQLGLAGLPQISTQNGTAMGPGQNPFLTALGGAGVGSKFGVPGALIGGGVGLLGGLFG